MESTTPDTADDLERQRYPIGRFSSHTAHIVEVGKRMGWRDGA